MNTVNTQFKHSWGRRSFNMGASPLCGILTAQVSSSTLGVGRNPKGTRPEEPSATLHTQRKIIPLRPPKCLHWYIWLCITQYYRKRHGEVYFLLKLGMHFQIYLTRKLNVLLNPYYQNTVQKFKESSFSFYSSRNPLKPKLWSSM